MKGRFIDGVWHCNCDPRLPASHFQVKKESGNKGRWFYCCTKPKLEQCGFFLWDEDAKVREEGVLLDNTRTELEQILPAPQTPRTTSSTNMFRTPVSMGRASTVGQGSSYRSANAEPSSEKRWHEVSDASASSSELDSSLSKTLTLKRKRDSLSECEPQKLPRLNSPPSSHRRAVIRTTARPDDDDESLETPKTVRRLDFGTPTVGKPLPTSSRKQRALMSFADPKLGETEDFFIPQIGDYPITQTILYHLNEPGISYATTEKIQQILNAHCLRISGIEKGRDITRQQLKKKDEKIAELERRVQELEQERELDQAVIRHFKKDMADSVAAKRAKDGRSEG